MLLESDILRLFSLDPILSPRLSVPVSGVDCPSVLPRQLLLFASSCPVSTAFSLPSSHQLPLLISCHQLLRGLLSNYQLCLLGRAVNSHSPPRTTSGYGEISCPRILCLVSRQNRQLNRLLWQPTPIVLQLTLFSTFQIQCLTVSRTNSKSSLSVTQPNIIVSYYITLFLSFIRILLWSFSKYFKDIPTYTV